MHILLLDSRFLRVFSGPPWILAKKHAHFPCELVSRKTNITAAIATSSHIIGFRACLVWNLYSTKFLHITDCPALRVKDKVAERFLRSLKICHWARFQTENKVLPSNLSRYCQNCKTIESYWIPGPVPSLHENNDSSKKLCMCACKLHRLFSPLFGIYPANWALKKATSPACQPLALWHTPPGLPSLVLQTTNPMVWAPSIPVHVCYEGWVIDLVTKCHRQYRNAWHIAEVLVLGGGLSKGPRSQEGLSKA